MRIQEIKARDIAPVKKFEVSNLSDLVVIAGPNGVGKTRLMNSFINYFQNFNPNNISFRIEATNDEEAKAWGKKVLDTSEQNDIQILRSTLHKNRRRRNFRSNILYYESNRQIQKINPLSFQFEMPDPFEESISWQTTYQGLKNRFQDTLHAIFKKIHNQRTSIASRAQQLKSEGYETMNLNFDDPLDPFKEAFYQLLGPKKLIKADLQNQSLIYSIDGQELDIKTLSSGESEVLNITFDFLLRSPSDCITFFDEPELHLHPELSHKLINTLKTIGSNNQFIFCSHSPDIISSSLDDSVIFISPDKTNEQNQAILIKDTDETNEALNKLGHSVGIVSLGKKIVLIEGSNSSLDKQTYGHILKNKFPNLVLVPSEGKQTIDSFSVVVDQVLDRTLWGVEFYMICDRDAAPRKYADIDTSEIPTNKFQILSRYHLENYFLESQIIAKIFQQMESKESWLCSEEKVEDKLIEIAKSRVSYSAALIVSKYFRDLIGNIDLMAKGSDKLDIEELTDSIIEKKKEEEKRINTSISDGKVTSFTHEVYNKLEKSIESNTSEWKKEIPGKQIINIFCNNANIQPGRFKKLYLNEALEREENPFEDVINIFKKFSEN